MIFQLVFVACHAKWFQVRSKASAEGISFGALELIGFGFLCGGKEANLKFIYNENKSNN